MTEHSAIRSLIEKAYEARVQGDLDVLMTYFHPDCRFQLMGAPEREEICRPFEGCEAVRKTMSDFIGVFTFSNFETLDIVVEGERAAYHWRADVTFVPTGRTERFQTLDLLSFADGKVRSIAQFTDTAGLARITAARTN
ncbi:nuclear transport factor 2 family protein [Bosea sp. BK604]|uniref:nuclear transport factor 2 family protein n=1 Tax=Bosea sp. BK604 TaxID=2512180 RepID=UPI001049980A|nr:nuclear transport factor 2 family protein [Bosea sp. BK604]TCR61697.1 ketosteroid isomerase-like protein [Bosea sp. BK604]